MKDSPTPWQENAELATLLLDALTHTARLFCESIAPMLRELKSGRSPSQLALDTRLQIPQGLLDGGLESLLELQTLVEQRLTATFPATETFPDLLRSFQQEVLLWRHFFSLSQSLMQRLERLREQVAWNATSYFPLGELWQEIQQTLQHN